MNKNKTNNQNINQILSELNPSHIEFTFENTESIFIPLDWVNINVWEEDINKQDRIKKGNVYLKSFECTIDLKKYNELSQSEKSQGYYSNKEINTFTKNIYAEDYPVILKRLVSNLKTPNIDGIRFIRRGKVDEFGVDGEILGGWNYVLPYNTDEFGDVDNEDYYKNINANFSYKNKDTLTITVEKGKDYNNIYNKDKQVDLDLVKYIGFAYSDSYRLFIDKHYFKELSIHISEKEEEDSRGFYRRVVDEINFILDVEDLNSYSTLNKGEYKYLDIDEFSYKYNNTVILSRDSDNFTKDLGKTILVSNKNKIDYIMLEAETGSTIHMFLVDDKIDVNKLIKIQ